MVVSTIDKDQIETPVRVSRGHSLRDLLHVAQDVAIHSRDPRLQRAAQYALAVAVEHKKLLAREVRFLGTPA